MMNAASDIEAAQQQTSEGKYYEGRAILHIEPFSRVSNLVEGKALLKLTKMQCAATLVCANSPQLRMIEAQAAGLG
jgi:hypothetical protein